MLISRKDWLEYIHALRRVNKAAASEMGSYIQSHASWNTPEGEEDAIGYAYILATKYGEGVCALSCAMYDKLAEAQKAHVPSAEPAPTATYDETEKAIRAANGSEPMAEQIVGRLVKQAGADTMLKNALRDGAEFAWIAYGDTCSFCLMLGSNGWRHASKKAIKHGHAEHIHANCDCEYAVRFDGESSVSGYDPDKLREQYFSAEGDNWRDRLNSLRREDYKVNKDKINEQKRIAYRARVDREKAPIITNTPKKPEKPVYGHRDVTQEWLQAATPNSHPITDVTSFTQDGVTYTVDGHNVKLVYSDHEKEIAELLERKLGGDIRMMPKVDKPESVETPDYLFNGERWDLKTMKKSTSKSAVYNALTDHLKQATTFVLDISENNLAVNELLRQAKGIFTSKHMRSVQRLVIVKDMELLQILERT